MISYIEGKIIFKGERFVVIDVNGVGYRVFVALSSFGKIPKKNEPAKLWTHLYMREDALELYGFPEYAELEFFETLIHISGIGPKSALGILSIAPVDTLKRAIASGETSYLIKVSGIGRKTAEKIILELKDKLGRGSFGEFEAAVFKEEEDVFRALRTLGYSMEEARDAIKQLPPDIKGTQKRIKEVLKNLGKS